MKRFIPKFLGCFYFAVFCYYVHLSIMKYMKGATKYESKFVDDDKVQYPSLSVCPKYTFKKTSVTRTLLITNESISQKINLVRENIWKKDDVFSFVNHPGIFGQGYPCVTLNDGTDPGKPCTFPVRYCQIIELQDKV